MNTNELICNILYYIDNNINNIITIDNIANEFYYNKFYIMKLFKKELNISIIDYINYLKIYNSIQFINNNNILATALLSGYNSQEYYCEMFKKTLRVTPSTFKKIINNEINTNIEERQELINKLMYIKLIIDKCSLYKQKLQQKQTPAKILTIFN